MPPRALMLCPEPPYPLHGGGAMRTAAMADYLSKRYLLDMILFREEHLTPPALPPGLVDQLSIVPIPTHRRDPASRALRNTRRALTGAPPLIDRFSGFESVLEALVKNRRWETVVVEHEWCAGYHAVLRPRTGRLVIDLHNIESAWHESVARACSWPVNRFHRRFAESARRLEEEWLPNYDLALTCSQEDLDRVPQVAGGVWPNTIPRRDAPAVAKKNQIAFSGNFEYEPNRTGAQWFAENVWPVLRSRHAGLEWVLVGRASDKFASIPGTRATGAMDDTFPEIAASLVAVVPLRSGSGTRIKILEAWSAGVPVVSTAAGAEGLPREAVRIADDSGAFADAVSALISSAEERSALARKGSSTFNTTFTWESGWKVLEHLGI